MEEKLYCFKKEELRELQLKSLEIYKYLKEFCEENNLLIFFCGVNFEKL